ncbi:MAG: hypothetical protein ABH919_04030 [bacterium]
MSEKYKCEICDEVYKKKEDADRCEKRGSPVFNFPIGSRVITKGEKVEIGEVVEGITMNKSHKSRYRVKTEEDGKIQNLSEKCLVSFNAENLREAKEESAGHKFSEPEDSTSYDMSLQVA